MIFKALLAAIPVILAIFKLFVNTPEEEREAMEKRLLAQIETLHLGVEHAQKTGGDTSELEKTLNE